MLIPGTHRPTRGPVYTLGVDAASPCRQPACSDNLLAHSDNLLAHSEGSCVTARLAKLTPSVCKATLLFALQHHVCVAEPEAMAPVPHAMAPRCTGHGPVE
eukprot:365891-Chlamydomonas_euryale.AAC.16